MVSVFGKIILLFALLFAFLQSMVPLWGYRSRNPYALAFARPSAVAQCVCLLIAYLLLTNAFVTSDFSLAYVAANSHPSLPFLYRLTAIWGAHEGSILLWVLLLNVWAMIFAFTQQQSTDPKNTALVLAILGLMSFCFLAFIYGTSNPFLMANGIQTGKDLNPLLQDPGFVFHPPMLYVGYVGFSAAFAITLAALIRGKLDAKWARLTRRFVIAAWCFLTLGITLGSWWAYRVLGWGGFWFWDPVENASLLPWLASTALIHVLMLVEKRKQAMAWAAFLALIVFGLSLLGTFLVRSGVLISAHTFANDPERGVFLLVLFALLSMAALIIYALRMPKIITSAKTPLKLASRETSLFLNSALLIIVMLTILLGTLYPLILEALHLGTLSVGAPYFNQVMTPLVLIILVFMGIAPIWPWENSIIKTKEWFAFGKKCLLSLLSAGLLLFYFNQQTDFITLITVSLSFLVILTTANGLRFFPSMTLAHFGFALLVMGVMLSSFLSEEREVRIKPGTATELGPYQFFFLNTHGIAGDNYRGIRADFEVIKNKHVVTQLFPEKRIYTVRDMVMTKVDIHPSLFRDLYIALGEPLDHDYWSVRLYYKPFIRFIWLGGIMMIIGGLFAIIQRKKTLPSPGTFS